MNQNYLTPEGAAKLKDELENLTTVKRQELSRRLREAIQMGDLSENADYIMAKEDQAFRQGFQRQKRGVQVRPGVRCDLANDVRAGRECRRDRGLQELRPIDLQLIPRRAVEAIVVADHRYVSGRGGNGGPGVAGRAAGDSERSGYSAGRRRRGRLPVRAVEAV